MNKKYTFWLRFIIFNIMLYIGGCIIGGTFNMFEWNTFSKVIIGLIFITTNSYNIDKIK